MKKWLLFFVWGIILYMIGAIAIYICMMLFFNEIYLPFLIFSPWGALLYNLEGMGSFTLATYQLPIYGFIILWATERKKGKIAWGVLGALHILGVIIAYIFYP